jgi:hypothetical protein
MLEVISPYIPIATVIIAVITLYNTFTSRRQDIKLKKQDLTLRSLEREDKFRYFPPHMHVELSGSFSSFNTSIKPKCTLVIANKDTREVLIEKIEFAYANGDSWPIDDIQFKPIKQSTTDKIEFDIDPDGNLFPYSLGKPLDMIFNIVGMTIRIKLSTDSGVLYEVNDIVLKKYLIYRHVKSYPLRKFGLCILFRHHKISIVHAFL